MLNIIVTLLRLILLTCMAKFLRSYSQFFSITDKQIHVQVYMCVVYYVSYLFAALL